MYLILANRKLFHVLLTLLHHVVILNEGNFQLKVSVI